MANPPFNISDWSGEKYENDVRWKYGRPPVGNANYAWLQHMLWKLKSGGQAGIVLANGSMSSNTSGEGQIRKSMIKADVIEVMISLPANLFLNTPIAPCLWFLTNNKNKNGRNRSGETLFIDMRNLGTMKTRVLKVLKSEDIQKITDTITSWRKGEDYKNVKGFCRSAKILEIEKNSFSLNPSRYVCFVEDKNDEISFPSRINQLVKDLEETRIEASRLDGQVSESLKKIRLT